MGILYPSRGMTCKSLRIWLVIPSGGFRLAKRAIPGNAIFLGKRVGRSFTDLHRHTDAFHSGRERNQGRQYSLAVHDIEEIDAGCVDMGKPFA